jgi:hypothetical protein
LGVFAGAQARAIINEQSKRLAVISHRRMAEERRIMDSMMRRYRDAETKTSSFVRWKTECLPRQARDEQRQEKVEKERGTRFWDRESMMCCRMFHPTNGRNNFDKHNCDESVISSLRMTELPSAEVRTTHTGTILCDAIFILKMHQFTKTGSG